MPQDTGIKRDTLVVVVGGREIQPSGSSCHDVIVKKNNKKETKKQGTTRYLYIAQ